MLFVCVHKSSGNGGIIMAYCKVCNEEIVEGSKFCVKCGTPIETREKERFNADEQTGVLDKQQGGIGIMQTINEENVPHLATNTVLENKDMKKSKKKLLVGIISAGVVGVLAIIAVVLVIVFNKTAKVDIGSFVLVEYSGYDTIGEANAKIDEEELIEAVADSLEKDEDEVADNIRRLVESFSYEISGNGELANGDKVKITVKYDEEMAEEYKLEILNASFSNEVDSLQELTEIDPFQYLKIIFEGCSGDGIVSIEKDITSEVVKELNFVIDKDSGLDNGDMITISLEESESKKGLEKGYKFTSISKEYEVAGLSSFYESLYDISESKMTVFQNAALENIQEEYKSIEEYAVLSDLEYVGAYFMKDNQSNENNILMIIYKALVESNNNDFENKEIYIPVKMNNLSYNEDGEFNGEMADLHKIRVMQKDYRLLGYLSDTELFWQEIFYYAEGENADNYIVENTEGVSELRDEAYMYLASKFDTEAFEEENSQIHLLMKEYIDAAYVQLDIDKLSMLIDSTQNINLEDNKTQQSVVESYENIKCYKLDKVVLNACVVFVSYDIKIKGVDTLLPSGEFFVLKYDVTKKQYLIHNMLGFEDYSEYLSIQTSVIANGLRDAVQERYENAVASDAFLYNVLK